VKGRAKLKLPNEKKVARQRTANDLRRCQTPLDPCNKDKERWRDKNVRCHKTWDYVCTAAPKIILAQWPNPTLVNNVRSAPRPTTLIITHIMNICTGTGVPYKHTYALTHSPRNPEYCTFKATTRPLRHKSSWIHRSLPHAARTDVLYFPRAIARS
jgi:hypothetical protein